MTQQERAEGTAPVALQYCQITATDLESMAMADPAVGRSLEGKTVRKVIVREPTLVNIVAG